ncbi:hypothetical protein HYALB_00002301 [Hymenoscyphus albidus]|uniref:FAD-binding PCMH-type domain-containing protein n=1 Tax=Hymenoscyphus albidus TaxID=595503 RepID=A0A9N9M3R8_9HELO|nr:hypothetical protein HYALB_00002301 [Hymenoscyphus albidus]
MRLFFLLLLLPHLALSFETPSIFPRAPTVPNASKFACKCVPGDQCWPSEKEWKAFNLTIGGRLRKAVPAAAVCYNEFEGKSYYDKAACDELIQNWTVQEAIIETTLNPIRPYYSNMTCWPTTNPNETCTIGYLSSFYIPTTTATAPTDLSLAINFARHKNIRFLVRNTGHDFMGRSVGYGSLAVNTHELKTVDFAKRYKGPGKYDGSAVTVGAGVQGAELYALAFKQEPKVVVVGGECPTVGYAGGYLQGGGHGPLATIYGMGADQVLSFDVVTATGDLVTANANSHSDLYWALKGGGPSTYAIAYRMTVKTPPEVPCAGMIININSTHTNDSALFWKAVEAFHGLSNLYVDNGMFV